MEALAPPSAPARATERMLQFERALVRVRWFGIALGVYQTAGYEPIPGTVVPRSMYVISYAALGVLVMMNVILRVYLRRDRPAPIMRRLSVAVFIIDAGALWAITWAYMFEQYSTTWVILLIACTEGAYRFQFRGAMAPVLAAIPLETARELYASEVYGHLFFVTSITFRIGMMAIIGFVAGTMARNLERERAATERRALELAELAEREAAARNESNAFQQVILAGVSADGVEEALQSMLQHIASDLGYTNITVLLVEEDRLYPVAVEGFDAHVAGESVGIGEGVAGVVAATGQIEIVPDVSKDPRYYEINASTRSQISLPIRSGERVIGVLHCESQAVDAYDEVDSARLERLCAQMALVIENARLLAQERQAVERLQELDGMKSDFIAIASHELRTPLTAIQGSIKTLRRPDVDLPPAVIAEMMAILDRQSDKLTRLVEDLLIVSRIDAGSVSLRMDTVHARGVLDDVLRELGSRGRRVSVAIPPTLPPLITDGQRLGQIVRNLVENGLKFSPDETTVRVTAHHDGRRLMIEVADDGPGIAPEDIAHIFDRFHQVGGSMRRRSDGFGLGLYVARRLVEALGGTIEVYSVVGTGTTFRVWLPGVHAQDATTSETA